MFNKRKINRQYGIFLVGLVILFILSLKFFPVVLAQEDFNSGITFNKHFDKYGPLPIDVEEYKDFDIEKITPSSRYITYICYGVLLGSAIFVIIWLINRLVEKKITEKGEKDKFDYPQIDWEQRVKGV